MFTPKEIEKFNEIGSGDFATVYEHPTDKDKVVKLIHDDCDRAFVKFLDIYRHSLNTYKNFAKIYEVKSLSKSGPHIIIQERIPNPPVKGVHYNGWNELIKGKDPDFDFLVWLLEDIADRHDDLHVDLHRGNFGVRDDGTLAIFDPYS